MVGGRCRGSAQKISMMPQQFCTKSLGCSMLFLFFLKRLSKARQGMPATKKPTVGAQFKVNFRAFFFFSFFRLETVNWKKGLIWLVVRTTEPSPCICHWDVNDSLSFIARFQLNMNHDLAWHRDIILLEAITKNCHFKLSFWSYFFLMKDFFRNPHGKNDSC